MTLQIYEIIGSQNLKFKTIFQPKINDSKYTLTKWKMKMKRKSFGTLAPLAPFEPFEQFELFEQSEHNE